MKPDPKKSTDITDLPVFVVTENVDIFSDYLCDVINECIEKGFFLDVQN